MIDNKVKSFFKYGTVFLFALMVIQTVVVTIEEDKKKDSALLALEQAKENAKKYVTDSKILNIIREKISISNQLGIDANDLKAIENPKGKGFIVFHPDSKFNGVLRNLIWVVIDGTGYAVNGPSKNMTPALKWPREAPASSWKETGLNPFTAANELVRYLY